MMDSGAILKEALAVLRGNLKEKGFSAKGSTFHRKAGSGNTLLLSVQKSSKSSPAETLVTINYGVYSARIGGPLEGEASSQDVAKTHWRKRLRESGREKWLQVKAGDQPDDCARLMVDAVEPVIAELERRSTDEALRDEWLSGSAPGIVEMQRLVFLAILVHELGPEDKLRSVLTELRNLVSGTVHEGLVERQLARASVPLQQ